MIRFIKWVTTGRRYFLITGLDGAPYLLRVLLWGNLIGDDKKNEEAGLKVKKPLINAYLHKFYKPDSDREQHNHPFKWGFSLILSGGYEEERLIWYEEKRTIKGKVFKRRYRKVIKRTLKPFSINIIRSSDFHRITKLHGPEVWTFFLAGPKTSDWGFIDIETETYKYISHEEFFSQKSAAR